MTRLHANSWRVLACLADNQFHSGQQLGQQLGLSRSAVCAHVARLRQQGLTLHSVTGRGYRLVEAIELLDAAQISAALPQPQRDLIQQIHCLHELDSTNQFLLHQLQQQPGLHGHVCLAERQHAGRGRRGRVWHSPLARNIYLSLCWQLPWEPSRLASLSLVVGLALVEALAALGAPVQLKWPNDIWLGDKKLAGILCELSGQLQGQAAVVIGIGINITMDRQGAAVIDQPWCQLQDHVSPLPSRNQLVAQVLGRLLLHLPRFAAEGFAPFAPVWRQWDALHGRQVTVIQGHQRWQGVGHGVDESGALCLCDAQGQWHYLNSGEVSVRPSDRRS